jgi:tripartite motif-containing protein 71
VVCVRDQLNEQRHLGGDPVKVSILDSEGRQVRIAMSDCQNGLYNVNWRPAVEGEHVISVTIKEMHIKDSPFR